MLVVKLIGKLLGMVIAMEEGFMLEKLLMK
jgi:hypothetical protein